MKPVKPVFFLITMLMLAHLLAGNLLQLLQWQAAHAMEEQLEHAQLVTLTNVPSHELVWVKKSKELLVNGHLFDVKTITRQQNGHVTITGLFDVMEQDILAVLQQNAQGNEGATRHLLQALFQQVYLGVSLELFQVQLIPVNTATVYPDVLSYLSATVSDIPTPPPQA